MWTLSITKKFLKQFLSLESDRGSYILESLDYILDVSDVTKPFDIDIVDEYEEIPDGKVMPITFKVDHEKETVYVISIDEKWIQKNPST